METLELTVKSVEEAVSTACAQWGVGASEVRATVVEEIPGLFGKAKLKVRIEPLGSESAAKPAPAKRGRAKKEEPVAAVVEEAPVEAPAAKPARAARAAKPKAEKAPEPAAAVASEEDVESAVATQEDADKAVEMVNEMLRLGDLEAEVKVRDLNGRYINMDLDGRDVAHLVGKQGEALNHFQYLVNIMYSRLHANGVRVTLDGNDYRRRREEKLTALAQHVANQVLERQEEAVFDALPAFERRVVHKALQEIDGITTYSEGEEPNRRVVIAPAQ